MKIICYIFLAIFVAFKFVGVLSAQSCSDVFLYNYSERYAFFYYYGSPNDVLISTDVYLNAVSKSELIHERFGLGESLQTAANHLKNNRRIWFKVKFLSSGPIPSVRQIIINKNGVCQLFCTGSEPSTKDTKYYIGYTFYPKGRDAARHLNDKKCKVDLNSSSLNIPCTNIFLCNRKKGNTKNNIVSSNIRTGNIITNIVSSSTRTGNIITNIVSSNIRTGNIRTNFVSPTIRTSISEVKGNLPPTKPEPACTNIFLCNLKKDDNNATPVTTQKPLWATPAPRQNVRCGEIDPSVNFKLLVYKGTEIERGSWPWLVALFRIKPEGESFQCGGNLVSERAVLTSAHCLYDHDRRLSTNEIQLYMGVHSTEEKGTGSSVRHYSKQFGIHPDYRADLFNFDADVAVILTKDRIIFTPLIVPVCIWEGPPMLDTIVNKEGILVGWGQDESGKLSNVPRRVKAKIVSDKTCLDSNDNFQVLTTKRNFCAGNLDGSGPCSGDSGGGLMLYENDRWQIRGTVSVSFPDTSGFSCNLTQYVVYTDIAKFSKWIQQAILPF